MFSHDILKDDGVVVLTVRGEVTLDDYQSRALGFFADVKAHDIRRLLIDDRDFAGWASGEAKALAFTCWHEGRACFDVIALVTPDGRKGERAWLLDLLHQHKIQVRIFASQQFEESLDWLKQQAA